MKKNIRLMYTIALLQGMVFYGPIATLYRQVQGVSIFQITLIESISLILCLLLEIPWGIIADKIGYRRTMIFCCSLYFLSKIVFWQATNFWWFLAERIMLGVVMAGVSGVDTSILYLSSEDGKSQKVFGVYNALDMAGLLIAAMVFSVFVKDDYKLAGGLTAVSYGLAAFASLLLTEVKPKETHTFSFIEFKSVLFQTLKNKHLIQFLVSVAFLSESHQTITVFLNQLQYKDCGMSSAAIGYIFIAVTLAGLSGVASAHFTRRTGTRSAGTILFISAVFSCVLLAFTHTAWLSVASVLILRISFSLFQPFQTELQNRQVTTSRRATALSVNAMITDGIAVGTNLVFGAFSKIGLFAAFLFGAGLCVAGLFLFYSWYRGAKTSMQI